MEIIEITAKTRRFFKNGYEQGCDDARSGTPLPKDYNPEDDYQRGHRRGWLITHYWLKGDGTAQPKTETNSLAWQSILSWLCEKRCRAGFYIEGIGL